LNTITRKTTWKLADAIGEEEAKAQAQQPVKAQHIPVQPNVHGSLAFLVEAPGIFEGKRRVMLEGTLVQGRDEENFACLVCAALGLGGTKALSYFVEVFDQDW
jgi:hypothetical protein